MRIVIVGEGMIELSGAAGAWMLGYGGDTLNTAIHLSRFGRSVSYATALGTDEFSDDLRAAWAAEGLDVSLILSDPDKVAGLYAIRTDPAGERSFTYWRNDSAARRLFALPDADTVLRAIEQADVVVFSLISLAILPDDDRRTFLQACGAVRQRGGMVAFDGNYRPRLWPDVASAIAARDAAIAVCSVGLPTLEDEHALSGVGDAAAVAAHWAGLGAGEVVVKLGAEGCRIDGTVIAPRAVLQPVDTSGAGDAFNAGYLNARLGGASLEAAALAGHDIAGWVIRHRGAVPARDQHAPYGS